MEVQICKTAGLCGGANRAYRAVLNSLNQNKSTFVYKELLHNEELIEDLKSRGVLFSENIEDANFDQNIILRAHGEEKWVYEYLNDHSMQYFDAICPNVKYVHELAIKKQEEGYKIIIIGKHKNGEYHDEVKSLITFLNEPIIITDPSSIRYIKFDKNQKYFLVSQTTYNNYKLNIMIDIISRMARDIGFKFDYENTICNFPLLNIENSIELAKSSNIAIVIGSKNSSNTSELYYAVKDYCSAVFSSDENEIVQFIKLHMQLENIHAKDFKICILAGASTLKEKLQNIKDYIEKVIK